MTQIDELRLWRKQAIETHMYASAELVGDKILALTGHPDDAYWLAQTYYGMGEYYRGADLITRNYFEQENLKCKYIAVLCLLQARELDQAIEMLSSEQESAGSATASATSSNSARSGTTNSYPGSNAPVNSSNNTMAPLSVPSPRRTASNNSSQHKKIRVLSTSSLKTPVSQGVRTISGSSRLSMILPGFEEDSLTPGHSSHNEGVNGVAKNDEELCGVFVESLLQFLLGRAYTMQSKLGLAKEAYIAALRIDSRCFDAMAELVKHHALTPKEEWALLMSLDMSRIGPEFGQSLYALRLSALTMDNDLSHIVENLSEAYLIPNNNCDILTARGNIAFARGQFEQAKRLYEDVIAEDRYNLLVYKNYVSCLAELGQKNQLYKVAHCLAAFAPESVQSLYAIGVYYLATDRIAEARAHFSKASLVDSGFAEGWLAFGRTFADEFEHEQAIMAFSTAAHLFPGYHLPYVYIGMQHLQLANYSLAEKYLATAADFFDEDPLLLNELGVVFYQNNELERSLQVLESASNTAFKLCSDRDIKLSITSNIAYVLRKMDRAADAYGLFERVCQEGPLEADVLAAMGLCLLQMGDPYKACQKLALALTLKQDDQVTNDLMKRAVEATSEVFDVKEFVTINANNIRTKMQVSFS